MPSQKQIEANRKNALRSTGPRTPEGKARSSRNAVKHGILMDNAMVESSYGEEYRALLHALERDLQPEGVLEQALVARITALLLRERNLIRRDAHIAEYEGERWEKRRPEDGHLWGHGLDWQLLIGRYQGMLGRQLREAMSELDALQARRRT